MIDLRCQTAVLLLALTSAVAPAQQRDLLRLDFDEPQIVIASEGRSGHCDVLKFCNSGRQLLAVGDDKVLHSWDVKTTGLEYRQPIRWNVFRERRGAIYALALSPNERYAAVAGYGRKDADVVILDRVTGRVSHALSIEKYKNYEAKSTVWSLAFDSTGKRLAVGQEDGSVWNWSIDDQTVDRITPAGANAEALSQRLLRIVWVGFSGDELCFARGDGSVFRSRKGETVRRVFEFSRPIAQAVAPEGLNWLAATPLRMTPTGTVVECRDLSTGRLRYQVPFTENAADDHKRLPIALAIDPQGNRMVIATWWAAESEKVRFSPLKKGDVRVYDLTPESIQKTAMLLLDGNDARPIMSPDALALDPTGKMLAIAGGPDHSTSLWKIEGANLIAQGEPSQGVGRGIWQVGSRAEGQILNFRQSANPAPRGPNDRGVGDWRGFDLNRLHWAESTEPPVETAIEELNGWRIEIDPRSELHWTAVNGDFRYLIPFDRNTDDLPTCYTFIPGPSARITRLAVGSYWGFKLFELRRGFNPRVVAKGIGHQGIVTSIAPARQGTMLVTGSNDQTIGIWALLPWEHHPSLGAKFEWGNDSRTGEQILSVTAVQAGSPAWEAGLIAGDRVTLLSHDAGPFEAVGPTTLDTIARAEADRELAFILERTGSDGQKYLKGTKTRMLTRPQCRFFPTSAYEWVLYRYSDYFYASSTNGDRYLGWLIGGTLASDTPEYHPANRFRELFYKPDIVQRSIAGLFREPSRPQTREYLPPAVELTLSREKLSQGDSATLSFQVRPRADHQGKQAPLELVELWLDDDVRLQSWSNFAQPDFQASVQLSSTQLRIGKNRLSVVAYARSRGAAEVALENDPGPRPAPAIRGLSVGVDQYPYLSPAGQLTAAVADAKLISEAFLTLKRDKLVRSADFQLLLNEQATPAAVLNRIERLGEGLGPDDWLVVFLAGHGLAEPEVTSPLLPVGVGERTVNANRRQRMKPGTWFFCGAMTDIPSAVAGKNASGEREIIDISRGNVREMIGKLKGLKCTISGEQILQKLQGLNCRKLVLLDSCHSGAIDQDPGRDLRPGDRGAVVITATAPDETATEIELNVERLGTTVSERHGIFSVAVYHVLSRDRRQADRNDDRQLTMEEFHRTIAASVRELRLQAGLDRPGGRSQTVLASPVDLRGVVLIQER